MRMKHGPLRIVAATVTVALASIAVSTATARAAITPSVSTSTATPLTAGATGPLDLDLKFSSGSAPSDSPKNLTINLPPGLLADAAIDDGQCLTTTMIDDPSPCQIGSGTVTAYLLGVDPVPTPVDFYLVPPPAPGDLAGLDVALGGVQVGTTGAITIRPSGSADGVGVSIALTLPNSLFGVPIDISEIDSTFSSLRYPATCPSTPADVTISSDSYDDAAVQTASMGLAVDDCSDLAYAPQYSFSASRPSSANRELKVVTAVSEPATDSPSSAISLAFPLSDVTPSLLALHGLCSAGPASGRCTPVGSVTADSPDYPTPLTGQAYLTGSLQGLTLTLVFPAPFPLTLVGDVDLKDNITTFRGLPDIPLTSLVVTLDAMNEGLFGTDCTPPSGTSTGTFTNADGTLTTTVKSPFTIAGCPTSSGGTGAGGSGAAPSAHVSTTSVRGLRTGHPSLRFTLTAARHSNVKSFTVTLPRGLSLRTHRMHGHLQVRGLSLRGGRIATETVRRGVLAITLNKAVSRLTLTIGAQGLSESRALRDQANAPSKRARLRRLRFVVTARNSRGRRATIHVTTRNLGL